MAHHHKNKNKVNPEQYQQYQNPLGNFDMSSILGMLNNIDMNQVSSMISQLGGKSGNSDSSNSGNNDSSRQNNFNPQSNNNQSFSDILNNVDMNQVSSMLSNMGITPPSPNPGKPPHKKDDRRIQVLHSLKPFLPEDKCKMIDEIINFLTLKGALDKAVPKKKHRK